MSTILYLMPGAGVAAAEKSRRQSLANTFLTDQRNKVIVDDVDEGPLSIESSIEGDLSVAGMLRKVIRTKGKYDAVIVGCADDPGLFSLRELLTIPVVGPFETSIAVASLLGERFGLITIMPSAFPETRMILRKYGAEQKCASLRAIGCSVADMIEGRIPRERLIDAFLIQAEMAVAEGASCLLMGCMSMAYLLLDEAIRDRLEVPVINPAKAAIKAAEMLLSLNLSHSRVSYPRPDLDKLRGSVLPELDETWK